MIPKQINYIWLGGKPLNRMAQICINSWRRKLPDYQIHEWNESSPLFDKCLKNKFVNECYKRKLWAFVSDYYRLLILNEYGGIYLDTDVEVLGSFDELLNNDFMIGYEKNRYIGTGVIGSIANSEKLQRLIDFYESQIWKVGYFNNPIIFKHVIEDNPEVFKNLRILPENVFCPYDPSQTYDTLIEKQESLAIHWYSGNWGFSRKAYVFLQTKQYRGTKKVLQLIKKNIGYYRNRKKWKVS